MQEHDVTTDSKLLLIENYIQASGPGTAVAQFLETRMGSFLKFKKLNWVRCGLRDKGERQKDSSLILKNYCTKLRCGRDDSAQIGCNRIFD
jgi:hypothetical protein